MTDDERALHEAALRGLLYLACPDADADAITETAEAIAQRSEETPQEPVPEVVYLKHRPRSFTPRYLLHADLSGADF